MAKYGDGTMYGDGTKYGELPRDYPFKQNYIRAVLIGSAPVNLEIMDGTKVPGAVQLRIEDVLGQAVKRCYFTHRSASGQDTNIAGHKEVLIKNAAQEHIFYGIIESFDEWNTGIEFFYNPVCVGWAWFLAHPGSTETDGVGDDAVVNEIYEDQTDAYIINDVLSKYCKRGDIGGGSEQPIFDATTHVATIETLPLMRFENLSPEQVLDKICKRTGGVYYVDDGPAGARKANLHYFAPGDEVAPYELMDDPAQWDYISGVANSYFPCRRLHRHVGATVANRVKVIGRRYVSPTSGYTTLYFSGDGSKTRFELTNKIIGGWDRSLPVVYVYEDLNGGADWYSRGLGGQAGSFAEFDIIHYFDEKYLKFASAPPSGTNNVKVECCEIIERTYTAESQASFDAIGHWIAVTVRDNRIMDDATAQLVAEKELAVRLNPTTYRGAVHEPGLRSGQTIAVTNAARGLSAEKLIIQKLTSRMIADGYWRYDFELGSFFPTMRDVIKEFANRYLDESEVGDSGHARGQIMFTVPGTLSIDSDPAPWYICSVPDGLQIIGMQLVVKTAPTGASIIIKAYRWLGPAEWWSMYSIGNEPYIAAGEIVGVDGTLSTKAGRPLLEKGQMIRIAVDQVGSGEAGADLTVSVMVRQ